MFRLLLFTTIICSGLSESSAQKYNYSVTPFGMNSSLFRIYNDNDSIYLFGIMSPKRKDYIIFKYLQINYNQNPNLNTIGYNVLDTFIGYWNEYTNILKIRDNFVFVSWGVGERPGDPNKQVFLRTNLKGDIVRYQFEQFKWGTRGDYSKIYMNLDSSFLVGGSIFDSAADQNPPHVFKLNREGKKIATKKLQFPWLVGSKYANFSGMDQLPNKNCLVGITQFRFNCDIKLMPFITHLLEVDSNLNTVRYLKFDTTKIYMRGILIENANKIFLYGQYTDTIECPPGYQMGMPYIAEIDSIGKLQWEIKYNHNGKLLDFCELRSVRKISGNNYLATGVYLGDTMIYDTIQKANFHNKIGLIFKFNTKGEILWSKYYYYNAISHYNDFMIEDITELSNKNLISVGHMALEYQTSPDTASQRGWVLVMDSLGNILKEDASNINPIISVDFIHIYPNPVDDFIQIELNENPEVPYKVMIYNIDGKKLIEKSLTNKLTSIETSIFNKGIYIIKVYQKDAVYALRRIIKN